MVREISTHRLLQIHVLADDLAARERSLTRACTNASRHGFHGFVRQQAPRLARIRRVLAAVGALLQHAEWLRRRGACRSRVEIPLIRRPANALNVEPIQPLDRCLNKSPSHWPPGMALRWRASGGEAYVFGLCSPRCPVLREQDTTTRIDP
jgi:hypothetical protein